MQFMLKKSDHVIPSNITYHPVTPTHILHSTAALHNLFLCCITKLRPLPCLVGTLLSLWSKVYTSTLAITMLWFLHGPLCCSHTELKPTSI